MAQRVKCPVCGKNGVIGKTTWTTPEIGRIYAACSDIECGARFAYDISFSHLIQPSRRDTSARITEFIESLSPEQLDDLRHKLQTPQGSARA